MRRSLLVFVIALAPLAAAAQDNAPGERPACVEVQAIARWGAAAYNHWVRVENGCDRPVHCRISTNVSRETHEVTIAAGQHAERLTYRGSPARDFTPTVACTLQN